MAAQWAPGQVIVEQVYVDRAEKIFGNSGSTAVPAGVLKVDDTMVRTHERMVTAPRPKSWQACKTKAPRCAYQNAGVPARCADPLVRRRRYLQTGDPDGSSDEYQ